MQGPDFVGNIFFGDAGFLVLDHRGFQVIKSSAANLSGEAARGSDAGSKEKYEKTMESTRTKTTPQPRT